MEHMRKRALVPIAATFLVLMLSTVPTEASSFHVARVVEIDYPRRVMCKQEFPVAVTFEYASRVLVDVGILEEETLRVVQSHTLISAFFGPGNVTFLFNLTAPYAPTVWRLIATTRAWWVDSWFSDPNLGWKPFAIEVVSADMFWLNVTSSHAFQVDNRRYEPKNDQEIGILLGRGRHTVLAEPVRTVFEGVRLVFDRWSDGVRSNPRVISLFQDVRLTAVYQTQYLLTVDSEHGEPTGGGWYDQNSSAWFAVLPEVRTRIFGVLEAKYVFDRWEGDWLGHTPVAAIQMSGPKRVYAFWRKEPLFPLWASVRLISFSMVLASLFFFIRGARRRRLTIGRKLNFRVFGKRQAALAVTVWLMVGSTIIIPSAASESAVPIKIGETYWRHWRNIESDTCIIWLGGGIQGTPLIINPYSLESYNTMQFVQDLARYYSVLTLERGSSTIHQTALNRTIRAEFYPSRLIYDARLWATGTGYRYVYLVGYSVGGIAAAREATIADPEGWASPNGIVLITVPLEEFVPYAGLLKANHLILFGTEMTKSFVDSGMSYYQSTPNEGSKDDHWLHKEFHIIRDVAHEVWTIARTGRYDSEAITVTVSFVERSKSLQLEKQKRLLQEASKNLTISLPVNTRARVVLAGIDVPRVVPLGEIFRVLAAFRWQMPAKTRGWVMLYSSETDTILSVREVRNLESESKRITLITRAPMKDAEMELNLIFLCSDDNKWAFPTGNYSLTLQVLASDKVDLIIKTNLPKVSVRVDGGSYVTNDVGVMQVEVLRGYHIVEVPPVINLINGKRAIFEGWSDGTYSGERTIRISESYQIEAFFRLQYYISASSEFGYVAGEGWYDQNATATVTISPPMIQDRVDGTLVIHKFDRWSLDAKGWSVALAVMVTEPMEVRACWLKVTYEEVDISAYALEVFASFSLLVVSMAFARKKRDSARDATYARRRKLCLSVLQGDATPGTFGKGTASHTAPSPQIHLVNLSTPMPKPAEGGTPRLNILRYH